LPALARAKRTALVAKAQTEISGIVTAINQYYNTYSRYPSSSKATDSLNESSPDFTFGTTHTDANSGAGSRLKNRNGALLPDIKTPGSKWQNSNAEVMGILLDLENFADGKKTPNFGHAKNPQKQVFLNAKMVGDTISPGIGKDGVFRDPWGNPYIITIDMNYDNKCRDGFYSGVQSGEKVGLIRNGTIYEAAQPVMVWSFGPDGAVKAGGSANQEANKDNILSWYSK